MSCENCQKPETALNSSLCYSCIDIQETKRENYKDAMSEETRDEDAVNLDYAHKRGVSDGSKNRAPIFRSTTARGIVACGDDPMAEEWDNASRQAYLKGYDEGYENT